MNKTLYSIIFIFFLFFLNKTIASENIIFLTLKNNEVNLRQGPSFEYPIKLVYKKKYLPVMVIDKSETWREIKDYQNNSGWIHVSQLSKKKSGINIKKNNIIYKKQTIYSEPLARLEIGRLVLVKKCNTDWCQIKTGGYSGWVFKNTLWGKFN
jgi:SH3-like domain-containing protein